MEKSTKAVGVCRLCHSEKPLLKSHVFSKGLVRYIRDESNIFVGINGEGRYGRAVLQDGQTEPLFCESCEQLASKNYEHPFFKLWNSPDAPIPDPWVPGSEIAITVNYGAFKLFHLMNLFRASVSSLRSFNGVSLGPHEEVMRQMLLNGDPGPDTRYAVACFPVFNRPGGDLAKLITMPMRHRAEGRTMYSSVYGGAAWAVLISEGGVPAIRASALKSDGTMKLVGHDWRTLTVLDSARALLAGKEDPPPRTRPSSKK